MTKAQKNRYNVYELKTYHAYDNGYGIMLLHNENSVQTWTNQVRLHGLHFDLIKLCHNHSGDNHKPFRNPCKLCKVILSE